MSRPIDADDLTAYLNRLRDNVQYEYSYLDPCEQDAIRANYEKMMDIVAECPTMTQTELEII
jgi:hypothetical protein